MRHYIDWVVGRALPTWSTAGFDRQAGRFRERLDWTGAPIAVPHRAMVQARQIYVFAHAAHLGWFPEGAELAEIATATMVREFAEASGPHVSFAFSITPHGQPMSDVRDAYTHAFVLFALSWLYRLNGDDASLELADRTAAYIDAMLLDPEHDGLFEAYPLTTRDKRQNPLMHLLEAFLSWERAAPGRGYLGRAALLVRLFKQRLFSAGHGVLIEHFAQDWGPHPDPLKAAMFEPGHHFEWVWLLREYEQMSGDDLSSWSTRLYDNARHHGLSAKGLVFDEVSTDRRVLKRSHRVWPHTEGLKAAAVRHASGDPDARPLAGSLMRVLRSDFLDKPFDGGWIDQISESGEPLVDYVPASTLYHLFFAATELSNGFAEIDGC